MKSFLKDEVIWMIIFKSFPFSKCKIFVISEALYRTETGGGGLLNTAYTFLHDNLRSIYDE